MTPGRGHKRDNEEQPNDDAIADNDFADGDYDDSELPDDCPLFEDAHSSSLASPSVVWEPGGRRRKRGWLKNLVAVLLGMCAGLFLRVVIGIPLVLLLGTEEGLPDDLQLILELFVAFVAGAVAGCLVPRFGWLFALFTQLLKILLTMILLGFWAYVIVTDPEVDFSIAPLRAPIIRLMLYAMITAAIGGAVAEKYRPGIMSFLASVFGVAGAGLGCAAYGFGFCVQFYFLYLGGKAFFEHGAILKALLFVFILGPIVSIVLSLAVGGVLMLGGWVFTRLHGWYAADLGLEPIE